MGQYLPKPKTEKHTQVETSEAIDFVATSMQGWRTSMEDAHSARINLIPGVHLFCVFDGHGGNEVSQFCAKYFPDTLKENQNFKNKKYKEALVETFLAMDEMMLKDKRKMLGEMFDNPELIASGCTAIVLLLTKNFAYVANAGDAKCVLFTKDKQVV